MLRALIVTLALLAATLPSAASDAAPEYVDVPDAPGWVAVLVMPEDGERINIVATFTVDNLFALLLFEYFPHHEGMQPSLGTGTYATKEDQRVRIVYDGEERVNETFFTVADDGPEHYFLGADMAAIPRVFLFYAAGDIQKFDIKVHSGHVQRVEMGPEAWAMWSTQHQDHSTRIYESMIIHGWDVNSDARPVSFVSPRGIMAEFGGGQRFDPATLQTPLGNQTCTCILMPDQTVGGEYVYTPNRIRGATISYWAFAPILPYLNDTETTT